MKPLVVPVPCNLLEFLFEQLPEVKRTRLRQQLKFGAIEVNGVVARRHDHALKPGDSVRLVPLREVKSQSLPELAPGLRLLHVDEDLIAIEKPAGLLSVATDPLSAAPTAYRLVTQWCRDQARSGKARVWIVHRLDRETSGVLLMARTEPVKLQLQAQWSEFRKHYVAVVEGVVREAQGVLSGFIDESQPHRVYWHDRQVGGARPARTDYQVLKVGAGYTLLDLRLHTGRRHQIRAQLAQVGWPVVGDERYGAKTDGISRLALHAASLEFPHPRSGQPVRLKSPVPASFSRLLGSAGLAD
jgi:23S rRNA pseudouridine1911/1915/1917 synthase